MKKDTPYSRFPSLNALRAFEAAARLGSFARAGDELRVTPGAVSAQIKIIEAEFGNALFERHVRGVRLTTLGEAVLPRFTKAFDLLADAVRDLRRAATPSRIHIATSPALAQLWLAPRLLRLRAILPDIDISMTTLEGPPELKRGPFDMCLFYTVTPQDDQVIFCDEEVFPVCTPALAQRLGHLSDLAQVPCIGDVVWQDWKVWAAAASPEKPLLPRKGPSFSLYAIAVQEALLGQGVLMGRRSLVAPHLASGALVAPFDIPVPLGQVIAAWMLPQGRGNPELTAVMNALRNLA